MKNKRIIYSVLFIVLVIVEVFIGVFVHDSFVRPYIGDVLIVIVIYCFIRIFIPEKVKMLPLYIFLFSAGVEVLQGLHIADMLGITSPLIRTIIGTVCDPKDIVCYAAGCVILGIYEIIIHRVNMKGVVTNESEHTE